MTDQELSATGFCVECYKIVRPSIQPRKISADVRGQIIEYDGLVGYCPDCGSEMDSKYSYVYNSEALRTQYRIHNDLIHPEQIQEILTKYKIGKRPLSLLLGWGEVTLTRYLNGYPAAKEYSELLKQIWTDPQFYQSFLERNRGLISNTAYKKSLRAVNQLFDQAVPRIEEVAIRVINQASGITHLKLQLIMFYLQQWSMVFLHQPLLEEDGVVGEQGSIFPSIEHKYHKYGRDVLTPCEVHKFKHLNEAELEFIDAVTEILCSYATTFLVKLAHQDISWQQAWQAKNNHLDGVPNSKAIISKDAMLQWATSLKVQYKIAHPVDLVAYLSTKIVENLTSRAN